MSGVVYLFPNISWRCVQVGETVMVFASTDFDNYLGNATVWVRKVSKNLGLFTRITLYVCTASVRNFIQELKLGSEQDLSALLRLV